MADIEKDFVHLARLALEGKGDDVAALARRALRQVAGRRPDLIEDINMLLRANTVSVTRRVTPPPAQVTMPVDQDSKLELLRRYDRPDLASEPAWPPLVADQLRRVLTEREREHELREAGLTATRSMLFVGPPGVGKTLAARWLARALELPLLVLDLSAVMSSFLGRTGGNIRSVLDYAQSLPSVLLLDEFDAIAKRRDDATEIGELKRLVTVLLQAVDDWPAHSLLIAATNHPELLDPAVWRRFERVIEFPLPAQEEIRAVIRSSMGDGLKGIDSAALAAVLRGRSFADVSRLLTAAKRAAVVERLPPAEAISGVLRDAIQGASKQEKLSLASELSRTNMSQRAVSSLTGLSRDTLRKHLGGARKDRSAARRAERGRE